MYKSDNFGAEVRSSLSLWPNLEYDVRTDQVGTGMDLEFSEV